VRELERELEAERDTLIASSYAEVVVPEALDGLTGEERTRVYQMLQLEVRPEGLRATRSARRFVIEGRRAEVVLKVQNRSG
jgi:hypothetical protein